MMTRMILAGAVLLAGCSEGMQSGARAPGAADAGACNPAAYAGLVGQDAVVALQIPEPKRSYRPDEAITTDFNPERVNVVLDDTDTIVEIKCG